MTDREECTAPIVEIGADALTIIGTPGLFTFEPGHPMRGANCLACRALIGDQPAGVLGVAVLGGEGCSTGCLASDVYLIHGTCRPADPQDMARLVYQGLACRQDHPWD